MDVHTCRRRIARRSRRRPRHLTELAFLRDRVPLLL